MFRKNTFEPRRGWRPVFSSLTSPSGRSMTQSLNDSGHNPLMMSAKELTVDLDEIMIEEKLSFNPLRKLIILVTLCGYIFIAFQYSLLIMRS